MSARKLIQKKRLLVSLGTLLVAATGVVTFAYWTAGGSGSGTAGTGTTTPLTVNQTSTVTGLYPGAAAQALSGNFNNPNTGAVYVGAVTASVTSTSATGCSAADFVIGGTATVNAEVPTGNNKGSWSGLTVAMTDTGSNQNACKSASITITYAAS